MRELLLPAHRLLHKPSDKDESQQSAPQATTSEPLTIPSTAYDTLRATLVRAELILLRVLGFELRIRLPLEYLPQYLERAMSDRLGRGWESGGLEDYEAWSKEEKDECGVTGLMDTGLGRACRASAVEAYVWQLSVLQMRADDW